jgi:hypothetical protein
MSGLKTLLLRSAPRSPLDPKQRERCHVLKPIKTERKCKEVMIISGRKEGKRLEETFVLTVLAERVERKESL